MMALRAADRQDFPAILSLNLAWEHVLSPMDADRLEQLHQQAAWHRVLPGPDGIQGFLLAFGSDCGYDSANYRWFDQRFDDFVYIDRIVIDQTAQGRGLGRFFYDALIDWAQAQGLARVCCEYDVNPPNEPSRRFHESMGFEALEAQTDPNTGKQVSLQQLLLKD